MSIKILVMATTLMVSQLSFADGEGDLDKEKVLSAAYVEQMAAEPNATVVEEGVVVRPIFKGESTVTPTLESMVHVSYYLSDRTGQLIEESLTSDEDVAFPLAKLIKCWQVALPKMTVGSLYKITCASAVAYGDKGAGEGAIKPGAALTFRIALHGVETAAK